MLPRTWLLSAMFLVTMVIYPAGCYLYQRDPVVLASALQAEGNHRRAITFLDRAIIQMPARLDAYARRGLSQLQLLESDAAMSDFEHCVQTAPQSPDVWALRAQGWTWQGEYSKAIADCDHALSLAPTSPSALSNRASARIYAGDLAGADKDIELALEHLSTAIAKEPVLLQRAILRRIQGDFAGAEADCSEVLRRNPWQRTAVLQRGLARHRSGQREQAQADFQQFLKLRPGFEEYLKQQIAFADRDHVPTPREDIPLALAAETAVAQADAKPAAANIPPPVAAELELPAAPITPHSVVAPKEVEQPAATPASPVAEPPKAPLQPIATDPPANPPKGRMEAYFTQKLSLYWTLLFGIGFVFLFTGLWNVEQNLKELIHSHAIPGDLLPKSREMLAMVFLRRRFGLVMGLGLIGAWFWPFELQMWHAWLLFVLWFPGITLAGDGRRHIEAIQSRHLKT